MLVGRRIRPNPITIGSPPKQINWNLFSDTYSRWVDQPITLLDRNWNKAKCYNSF